MRNFLFFLLSIFIINQASAQANKSWQDGSFYDLNGNKFSGLINRHETEKSIFTGHGDYIWFKKDKDDERHAVSSDSIRSYVAGIDSFVVTHAPDLKKTPFLMVVIDEPTKMYLLRQVKRYSSISYFAKYDDDIFYYGTDPDHLTEIKKDNFLDAMSKILVQMPDLFGIIKSKQYTLDNTEEIVQYFRRKKLKPLDSKH